MSIEQLESITKNHTFNEGALLFWLQKNLDGFGNQMEISEISDQNMVCILFANK